MSRRGTEDDVCCGDMIGPPNAQCRRLCGGCSFRHPNTGEKVRPEGCGEICELAVDSRFFNMDDY